MRKRLLLLAFLLPAFPVGAVEYRLVPESSSIRFEPSARFGRGAGQFRRFTAAADVDEALLENSRIEAVIEIDSIDTGIAKRDKHLRSKDFFHTEAYPQAILLVPKIDLVTKGYLGRATLRLCGVTKEVDLPFTAFQSEDGLRIEGRAVIRRMDFGIAYQSFLNPIKDEVEVFYSLLLRR